MKELTFYGGSKTYSNPSYIFSGVKAPQYPNTPPQDLRPCPFVFTAAEFQSELSRRAWNDDCLIHHIDGRHCRRFITVVKIS